MAVKGIDLSHWQGHPNFAEVKAAGYEFAILKAGEGAGYLDGSFYESVGNAAGVGLIVGAYYFAQPGQSDGVTQAEAFLRILSRTKLVSNAWLDIEVSAGLSPAALAHWCDGFLSTLRAGFHGKVGAYSGQSYSSELGGSCISTETGSGSHHRTTCLTPRSTSGRIRGWRTCRPSSGTSTPTSGWVTSHHSGHGSESTSPSARTPCRRCPRFG
jgi:hypothetical protein